MILVFSDGLGTTTAVPEDAARVCNEDGMPVYAVLLGHGRLQEAYEQAISDSAKAAFAGERGSTVGGDGQPPTGGSPDRKLKVAEESLRAANAFASLGVLTGGRDFDPPEITLDVMQRVLEDVALSVSTEYIVGFSPEAGDGKPRKHTIEIRLRNQQAGKVLGGSRSAVY